MYKLVIRLFLFYSLCSIARVSFAADTKLPNVSGAFYPSGAKELSQKINNFLSLSNPKDIPGEIIGLISPHAGYDYSGQVAAFGFKAVKDKDYNTVVVIAPSHFVNFSGIAIWPKGEFKTPLGNIIVDAELSKRLMELNPQIKDYAQAFSPEHSLEVQLPFLQTVLKDFKLIPLIMGDFKLSDCELLSYSLSILLRGRNALIIASTDMSHYHTYKMANSMDNLALSYIQDKQPEALYTAAKKGEVEFCGLGPVLTILYLAQEKDAEIEVLKYANSGDVTGDYSRVVGYSSIAIVKKSKERAVKGDKAMLNKEQRKRLLEIARRSIDVYLKTGKKMEVTETDPDLNKKQGAFVTLTETGELRGCIGNLISDEPLYLTIRDMSIEAAVNDPRFPALSLSELKNIEIEISVLSELEKVSDPDLIEMGKHGVLIRKGFRSGVFLPQVAEETGWTKEEFLTNLCVHKAGLEPNCWRNGSADIYIFTAEVFNEREY